MSGRSPHEAFANSALPRSARRAQAGAAAEESTARDEWRSLRYFTLYRLSASGLAAVLGVTGVSPPAGDASSPLLFDTVSVGYFGAGILFGALAYAKRPGLESQVLLQVFADILFVSLLMHASGGVTSGFGILLVVSIVAGSLLVGRKVAVSFAALGTVAVLVEQAAAAYANPAAGAYYTHAGILGVAFFGAAWLANVLASRLRASQALVAEQDLDLKNLAQVNEYVIRRMQSGILVVDGEDRVVLSNESSKALIGISAEPAGERLEGISAGLAACMAAWRRSGERSSFNFSVSKVGLELTASFAALGPAGGSGTLVFLEDSSAVTQRAQQLKLASLGRLTASIAHEIRNPLAAISHAGQLLEESEALVPADRRLSEIIETNCRRMNDVIKNVLELSRRRPAVRENLELGDWLSQFLVDRGGADASRSVQIDRDITRGVQAPFDAEQLRQVVGNLLDNAIRHGGTERSARVRIVVGIGANSGRPYLDVTDEGQGIARSERDAVFEPFFTTGRGGTGLGLYIARELCEMNQASLRLLPSARGCHFRITFADPRRRARIPEEAPGEPVPGGVGGALAS